jgi:myo-inositol-1(or 4)-monophosphatase
MDSKGRQARSFSVLAGVIFDPMRDEVFSAAVGQGAMLNGRPIQVSPTGDLAEAVIGLDWSHSPHTRQLVLSALHLFAHHVFTIRALGTAALALAWIAAGRLDGYINFDLKPWDIAAASLLIQEAGGYLSHVESQYDAWSVAGSDGVASNGRIHQGFLQLLGAGS